jgi:hypothetical protein
LQRKSTKSAESCGLGFRPLGSGLEKVPLVAVEVFEDGDGVIGLFARSFKEADARGLVGFVIAPEVVGMGKEEDAASGLIADGECAGGRLKVPM